MCTTAYIVLLGSVCGIIAQKADDPLCVGCVFVNGAAFNDYYDCTKYVQCDYDADGYLVGVVRNCSFSTYWNLEKLTCDSALTTPCKKDHCYNKPKGYKCFSETNCRGYWECDENKKSHPHCCSENQLYDDELGCVDDVNNVCNDSCFDVYEPPKPRPCNSFPVRGEPAKYMQNITGWGRVERKCPLGTLFVPNKCQCISIVPHKNEDHECMPEIHLTFDKDHTDQSLYTTAVINQNVEVKNGVAIFNGINSRLIIPRFNNFEHSSTLIIRAKYSSPHQTFSGMARALVVNSDCKTRPSIMVSEDSTNVYFGVGTNIKKFVFTYVSQLPVDKDDEKHVEFKFKSGMLSGSNGVNNASKRAPGFLRGVRCALQIGYADQMEYFNGTIDELTIYLCDPDE